MVLEYLEGGSLESLLRKTRETGHTLKTVMLCRMASEVAAGLAFLHRNGVIHRDVKAANVARNGGRSNSGAQELSSAALLTSRALSSA